MEGRRRARRRGWGEAKEGGVSFPVLDKGGGGDTEVERHSFTARCEESEGEREGSRDLELSVSYK